MRVFSLLSHLFNDLSDFAQPKALVNESRIPVEPQVQRARLRAETLGYAW